MIKMLNDNSTIYVYISHKYGGNPDNVKHVEKLIINMVNKYEHIQPISPIHATGFLYDVVSYDRGIEWCLNLLKDVDCMVVFGDDSISKGCMMEKDFCQKHNIPVIEYDNFDKWYKNRIKLGDDDCGKKEEENV